MLLLPEGFEPPITVPKTVVISVSLREHVDHLTPFGLHQCGYGESNPDLVLGKDAFYH